MCLQKETPTIGNYYDSDVKLDNASNGLYSLVWFNMNKSAFYGITDVISGNMYADIYNDFGKFTDLSFTNSQSFISDAWRSCYGAIANSNAYINSLPKSVGPNVTKEALTMLWGNLILLELSLISSW